MSETPKAGDRVSITMLVLMNPDDPLDTSRESLPETGHIADIFVAGVDAGKFLVDFDNPDLDDRCENTMFETSKLEEYMESGAWVYNETVQLD